MKLAQGCWPAGWSGQLGLVLYKLSLARQMFQVLKRPQRADLETDKEP